MRQKAITLLLMLLTAVAVLVGKGVYETAFADSAKTTPGMPEDPIVTKSYVDASVAATVKQQLQNVGSTEASKLEVINLAQGQTIIVGAGGELIVRSGKAIAYSTDANGLSDLTDGIDVAPGKPISANHLILFPRDGRGVLPDPAQKNGLILLVRGTYQIQ